MIVAGPDIDAVRRYWDEKPLLSMKLEQALGTKGFLATFAAIRADIDVFAQPLYEFDRHRGEKVLDVGCGGPAYMVRSFGIAEVHRILKPGGRALIALYHRSFLLHPWVSPFTRVALRLMLRRVAGRERMARASKVDDCVRMWDGDEDSLGPFYRLADRRGAA